MKDEGLILYDREVDFKRLNFIYNNIISNFSDTVHVLDIGCGNGNISIYLGSKGLKVTGIDLSSDAISIAKSKNPFDNVELHVKDAEKLIFEGKKYDVIICSEVLEHLHEPERLLNEISSLLTESGMLIVTVPNGIGPRELFITRPIQWLQEKDNFIWKLTKKVKHSLGFRGQTNQSAAEDLRHVQFFTRKDIYKLAQSTSFSIQIFQHADFISDVFPFSLLSKRISTLQRIDIRVADFLPHFMTSGFNTVWYKK